MPSVVTEIDIAADPQTVWSILDDLPRYPEWNPVVPRLKGRTTLNQRLDGELVIRDLPTPPLTPRVNRVVAVREFRWISEIPGDTGFTAEHIFVLSPKGEGTHLVHSEIFEGPASPHLVEPIKHNIGPSYEAFNQALKARAERFAAAAVALHPAVDAGLSDRRSTPLTLRCGCDTDAVIVEVAEPVSHNHLCGCSKCWKPQGAIFAQTAVVARDAANAVANAHKLIPVDPDSAILRHACAHCGTHMIGTVEDPDHHFFGIAFVHPELAIAGDSAAPEFAGFVSSVIENGFSASLMQAVRTRLHALGLPSCDGFSPEICDVIAYHKVKQAFPSNPA